MVSSTCQSEVWKDVPGMEEYFQVSDAGRIRSKDRVCLRSDTLTPVSFRGKVLTGVKNRSGYLIIRTSISAEKITLRPHRIVAGVFVPNPENKPQVNHLDGDKSNNSAANLEWVTNSENQLHAIASGLKYMPVGKNAMRFERAVDVFRNSIYITTLYGNADMAGFGVDYRNVSACLLGKRKTHRGYTFKIKEV